MNGLNEGIQYSKNMWRSPLNLDIIIKYYKLSFKVFLYTFKKSNVKNKNKSLKKLEISTYQTYINKQLTCKFFTNDTNNRLLTYKTRS